MNTSLKSGQTVVFIGDSITEADRRLPQFSPLGVGFVRFFSDLIQIRDPEKKISFINKGINSNTISHLLSRWSDDVLEHNPDVLFILIGINDATRFLDKSSSLHCSPDEFVNIYRRLIDETKRHLPECRIILLSPFFISAGDNINGSYRKNLIELVGEYIQAVHTVSNEFGVEHIQLSETFRKLIRLSNSSVFSEDKIHPNQTGHLAIAEAIYRGFQQQKDS